MYTCTLAAIIAVGCCVSSYRLPSQHLGQCGLLAKETLSLQVVESGELTAHTVCEEEGTVTLREQTKRRQRPYTHSLSCVVLNVELWDLCRQLRFQQANDVDEAWH